MHHYAGLMTVGLFHPILLRLALFCVDSVLDFGFCCF